jgi:hypothetical protein
MGTYNGSMTVDLEYPMAFVESMGAVVQKQGSRVPFRFVLLSGKFVRQNQEEKLYFMEKPRKIKVSHKDPLSLPVSPPPCFFFL